MFADESFQLLGWRESEVLGINSAPGQRSGSAHADAVYRPEQLAHQRGLLKLISTLLFTLVNRLILGIKYYVRYEFDLLAIFCVTSSLFDIALDNCLDYR